ncbi:MAG: hypothetical protein KJ725_06430, partial [Gammaproteobacteria bacterium]|nr:hypothetical protein [Gammaproteobacteria bacterium]
MSLVDGSVTRLAGRREYVRVGLTRRNLIAMDGMNADFALRHGWRVLGQCRSNCRGAKICPAADTCQSSNR